MVTGGDGIVNMKIMRFLLVPGLFATWLAASAGNAKEPVPSVDAVLAKWEEAARKCKMN